MLALTLAASAFAPPTLAPRPASAVRAAEPQMVAKQNFGPIKNPGSGVSGLTRRSPTAIDPRTSARTHTLTYTPDRTRHHLPHLYLYWHRYPSITRICCT